MDSPPDHEIVVVAAVLVRDRNVLMVHRPPSLEWYPDTWDLPTGEARAGEDPASALVREMEAILGIRAVVTGEPVAHLQGSGFRKDIWLVGTWHGTPRVLEPRQNDDVRLIAIDELKRKPLADPRLLALISYAVDGVE